MMIVLAALTATALAESRHTTEAVALRKKPGEKEPAIAQLPANTEVTVIAEEGRWVKVRVKGVVGYLTRTTISELTAADTPDTVVWSASRKSDELFVEVTAPAALLTAEPKPTATKVTDVATGTHLVVIDAATTPGWIHARDDAGHEGWISRAQVDNGANAVTITNTDLRGSVEVTYTRPPRKPLAIRAALGLGYRSLGMDLTSNSEGGLTNYLVDADAVAGVLDVDVAMRLAGVFVAADARVVMSESSPGIEYPGPTRPTTKIPFTTFATDGGVRLGVRARDTFDLALRVGGHYDAFITKQANDPSMPSNLLPRERLLGLTGGVRADIAPPHSRFGAVVRVDYLVIGSRAQTPGLEDGTANSAHGLWGGFGVTYQVSAHVTPFAAYDFGRAWTSWTGRSVREPSVTNAHRSDTSQLVQIGITAEL